MAATTRSINDFEDGIDLIDLSSYTSVSTIGDLGITQDGADAVISAPEAGDIIRVKDTTVANFTNEDFIFS